MVTVVDTVTTHSSGAKGGYEGYIEPDTKIPPKARPILDEVTVNGVVIPEVDILAEAQNHPADNPGLAALAAARALVVKELLLQEAKLQQLEPDLQNDAEGRRETHDDAAIRLLIDQEIDIPVASDKECRRYYENNLKRFQSEPIYEVRHILLAGPASDQPKRRQAKAAAADIITALTAGEASFEEMAQTFSACPSKQQGGNLGQITKGATVAEFEAALEEMQEGELRAEPLETPFGYHVVQLDRKISGSQLPYEHASQRIAAWLEAASWSRAVSQYVGILAGQAKITGVDLESSDGPLVQ